VGPEAPLPPPPPWLIKALATGQPITTGTDFDPFAARVHDTYGQRALEGEVDGVLHATVGTRNATLNRAAFRLGQLVGADLLDEDEVRTRLTEAAMQVGLGVREIHGTVESGVAAGRCRPRYPRADTHLDDRRWP
jgi:hypothetical protein